jgi:glycosyltransferase involved in cell wall biosynthesis
LGYAHLEFLWQAWCEKRLAGLTMEMPIVCTPSDRDVLIGLGDFWCHRGHVDALIGLKERCGMRLVQMVHDLFPLDRPEWSHPLYGPEFVGQLNQLAPHVDRWLVNSAFVSVALRKYLESLGRGASPIDILAMGNASSDADSASISDDLSILAKYGLGSGSYVLHVGTVEPRKNVAALLDALKEVRKDHPHETPICLLVGRDGWKSEILRRRLKETAFEQGSVRWIRNVPDADLPALYRGARFTVVPSLGEGWGLAVRESLGQGTPCIASSKGGLLEAGADLARYVDPERPDELRLAMADWIAHDDVLEKCRERIRRRLSAGWPFVEWRIAGRQVMEAAAACL